MVPHRARRPQFSTVERLTVKMLQVRQGKEVRDAKGNILGTSGVLLPVDAPIRDSDWSKVIAVEIDDQFEPLPLEDGNP